MAADHAYDWCHAMRGHMDYHQKQYYYRQCYQYVMKKMNRPCGFIGAVIGVWILSAVVSWVVWRVLDYLFRDYKTFKGFNENNLDDVVVG
jgi:hypothetical protein